MNLKQNKIKELVNIEYLFTYSGDDFNVWKEERHGHTYYKISVEGYMGFEDIPSIINIYKEFQVWFKKYLNENHPKDDSFEGWNRVYKSRAIEVCYEHDCYWVFLDTYESTSVWELYKYMDDVIKQLEKVNT